MIIHFGANHNYVMTMCDNWKYGEEYTRYEQDTNCIRCLESIARFRRLFHTTKFESSRPYFYNINKFVWDEIIPLRPNVFKWYDDILKKVEKARNENE